MLSALVARKPYSNPIPDVTRSRTRTKMDAMREESSDFCEHCYEGDYNDEERYRLDSTAEDSNGSIRSSEYETSDNEDDMESRPVASTNVPTLKVMSSLHVAIALWYHLNVAMILSGKDQRHSDFSCLLREKVYDSMVGLSAPKSIAEEIVKSVNLIRHELKRWVCYNFPKVFFNFKTIRYVYNLIYHIEWYSNGAINQKQTARNLLTCDRLSNIDKYHISCLYCLKDEIQIVSASLFKNNVIEYVKFSHHPLIFYWNCYFQNRYDEIPVPEGMSVDSFMFSHRRVDNWPAKEYFFERLSYDDQIQNAVLIIDKYGLKYQALLLSKLDESQLLRVFLDRSVKIMKNYAKASNVGNILRTWREICNLIDQDQFFSIFQTLVIENIDEAVLKEIWIDVSDDFREFVLKYNDYETICSTLETWVNDNDKDLFFTLMSGTSKSFKKSIAKEWFFPKCCVELMSLGRFPMLDKLLDVCFPDEQDAAKFKTHLVREDFFISYCKQLIFENNLDFFEHLLNTFIPSADKSTQFKRDMTKQKFFSNYCEKLITSHKFTELDDLFKSFLPEIELATEFKKTLFINSISIKLHCLTLYSTGDPDDLNDFLFKLLPTSLSDIVDFKKALILTNEAKKKCQSYVDSDTDVSGIISDSLPPEMATEYKKELIFAPSIIATFSSYLRCNQLNRVTKCIDRYLSSVNDKIELKKLIIGDPIDLMCSIFRKYNENYWNAVLIWWLGDDESVYDFVSTLPIDNIFDEMLKECIFSTYDSAHRLNKCKFKTDYSFTSIDRFLSWFFETPAKIKEYKLHRVDSYMEIDTIKTLLKKKDDQYLKAVMNWFFQGNAPDIERFRMKNRGRKILNFL